MTESWEEFLEIISQDMNLQVSTWQERWFSISPQERGTVLSCYPRRAGMSALISMLKAYYGEENITVLKPKNSDKGT